MQTGSALLFDLDGTLIDSLVDLTTALNLVREEYRLGPLAATEVAGMVGDGARKLVLRALPEECQGADNLSRFLAHYRRHLCEHTAPYPGVMELLQEVAGRPLAVVTNKPHALAVEILDRLGLRSRFGCVIGGDSCAEKKPHPLPVRKALERLGCEPDQAVMIGDHHTDLHAGHEAGCRTCFCTWGFGNKGGVVPDWEVNDPYQLALLLRGPGS